MLVLVGDGDGEMVRYRGRRTRGAGGVRGVAPTRRVGDEASLKGWSGDNTRFRTSTAERVHVQHFSRSARSAIKFSNAERESAGCEIVCECYRVVIAGLTAPKAYQRDRTVFFIFFYFSTTHPRARP